MIIMILGGLYALIFGRISVSRKFVLKGQYARTFGLTLLALAFPVSLIVSLFTVTLSPNLLLDNTIFSLFLSVAFTIIFIQILCYPYVLWQRMDIAAKKDDTLRQNLKRKILLSVGVSGGALLLMMIYTFAQWFPGGEALKSFEKSRELGVNEGSLAGSGKSVDDCLNVYAMKANSLLKRERPDINSFLTTSSFLEGCVNASTDHQDYCEKIPGKINSAEYKTWMSIKCKQLAIDDSQCELTLGTLPVVCTSARLKDILSKAKTEV